MHDKKFCIYPSQRCEWDALCLLTSSTSDRSYCSVFGLRQITPEVCLDYLASNFIVKAILSDRVDKPRTIAVAVTGKHCDLCKAAAAATSKVHIGLTIQRQNDQAGWTRVPQSCYLLMLLQLPRDEATDCVQEGSARPEKQLAIVEVPATSMRASVIYDRV